MDVLSRTATGEHIVRIRTRADFEEASALYATVFGYGGGVALNSRLLRAITQHGGVAVGARASSGVLIAFAYGFPAFDGTEVSLYSQAAVVHSAMQGRGLGRALKDAQRTLARQLGYRVMKWSFDPALARNAHFNFDVLGTTSCIFHADYYDDGASDRLIVEWDLMNSYTPQSLAFDASNEPALWGLAQESAHDVTWVTIPRLATAVTPAVRTALARTLSPLLSEGGVIRSCRPVDDETSAYAVHTR